MLRPYEYKLSNHNPLIMKKILSIPELLHIL